jgi:hypothetical protein
VLAACSGAAPPASKSAEGPTSASSVAPSEDDKSLPAGEDVPREGNPSKTTPSTSDTTDPAPPPQSAKTQAPDPEFRAGMSVNEAINAVPTGTERVNLDQEALEAPIVRAELYEPCKLTPSQHFKVRVAIWDGRAVGLDIETTPKNDKFAACLREQIESVRWQAKAKSLNTVEYAY